MARGSSYGEDSPLPPRPVTPQTNIPRRATRELPAVNDQEERETHVAPEKQTGSVTYSYEEEHQLARHRPWLPRIIICMVCVVLDAIELITAGVYQQVPANTQDVNHPTVQYLTI